MCVDLSPSGHFDILPLLGMLPSPPLVRRGQDFQRALGEVQPKFGADNQELQTLYANGIVSYSQEFEDVRTTLGRLVEQTRLSERTPIMSVRLPPRRGEEERLRCVRLSYMLCEERERGGGEWGFESRVFV